MIISVASGKGGTGKTTVAVALALSAAPLAASAEAAIFLAREAAVLSAPVAPAIAFWRKVIGRYTGGHFQESDGPSPWGQMKVIHFRNHAGV